MTTKKQARDHAQAMANLHNENWYLFKVAKGTAAYDIGIKFASYSEREKSSYVSVDTLETITPKKPRFIEIVAPQSRTEN
jgi:hypothetical protein